MSGEVIQVMTVIWRGWRVEKRENLFVNSRIEHSLWGVYGSQTREPSDSGLSAVAAILFGSGWIIEEFGASLELWGYTHLWSTTQRPSGCVFRLFYWVFTREV